MIFTIFKDQNFNIFDNSSVFHICLFDVRRPEDDLTRSKHVGVSVDCIKVKVYILILVYLLVLSIKFFVIGQI